MNLYAVFVDGAVVVEIVGRSKMTAYHIMLNKFKIPFRPGVKIYEVISDWCDPNWGRKNA